MSALKIVGPYGTRHIIFNECVKNNGSLWDPLFIARIKMRDGVPSGAIFIARIWMRDGVPSGAIFIARIWMRDGVPSGPIL